MNTPEQTPWRIGPGLTAGVCAALLVVFGTLSCRASLTKSATYDEPLHVLGGFLHRHYLDFRINPEDPALFGWIVALPNPKDALRVEMDSQVYRSIVHEVGLQWPFIWVTLYRTGGNDEQLVLNRSRAMCTLMGVVLGAVLAWWSYKLGGSAAAIAATTLYAFCPNFLAHASIVKNDVPLSAVLLGLMFSLWLLGRRGSWLRLAAVALLCGAALGIKYSGVLAGPIVVITLTIRALLPQAWEFVGINLQTRGHRLLAVIAACLVSALVAWVCVWAVYGFRFNPTPEPGLAFNMSNLERLARAKEIQANKERVLSGMRQRGEEITDPALVEISEEEIQQHEPGPIVRLVLAMNDHRLLPQGWLAGFLYTYATTLVRSTYLNGEIQILGWWYFFPLAMLYKTPAATLVAAAAALLTLIVGKIVLGLANFRRLDAWALACLLVAPLLYGASAMSANLNLGLRHILPVYPYIFIGIGVVTAMVVARWRMIGLIAPMLLAIGLIAETGARYPNLIPFFNIFAGGPRGGVELLGDSNLDWGQDLKLLAQWQRENPDTRIYLSYFGIADPEYYGVKAINLPGGYIFAEYTSNPPQEPDPARPGVLAISATNLQGIYMHPDLRKRYHEWIYGDSEPRALDQAQQAIDVLGGSIYLFRYPPTQQTD